MKPDLQTFPSTSPTSLFYNDLNPDLAALFAHELRNQSLISLISPTGIVPPAWADNTHYAGRRAYGFTVKDEVVPLETQEAIAGLAGVDFVTRYFEAGHSPFLSVPDELGEWIVGLAMVWEHIGGGDGGQGGGGYVRGWMVGGMVAVVALWRMNGEAGWCRKYGDEILIGLGVEVLTRRRGGL